MSDVLFQWVSAFFTYVLACIEKVGPSRKVKGVKRESEEVNGKVIDKKEREGNGRKYSFIFCFDLNVFFFPSDTPSLGCQ